MAGAALLPLLLLLPGSLGLQCLSCGAHDGGSCREASNVTCPPESQVCSEALAAVTWSHGSFELGGRGCGRGQPGALARALTLPGLVVFERRRNCQGEGCNGELPLGESGAELLPANESARSPNGLRCYGCPAQGPCPPSTIVRCYGDQRGCFHGNVTLRMGNLTWWRELRGCVPEGDCGRQRRGDGAAALSGSCCSGDLCNGHLANHIFFEPHLPRLELLPHGHAPTAAPGNATGAGNGEAEEGGGDKMAEGGGGGVDMADGEANMAGTERQGGAGSRRAAGGKMADGNKMEDGNKMDGDKMADGNKMADGDKMDGNKMAGGSNMAAGSNMTTGNNMAARSNMTTGNNMAAGSNMADRNKMADGDKMAAGSNTAAGHVPPGRPMGRKDGSKGPVGRSQALGGPGWLLPFLLWPLLR